MYLAKAPFLWTKRENLEKERQWLHFANPFANKDVTAVMHIKVIDPCICVYPFELLLVSSGKLCVFSAHVSVQGAQGWGGVCDHVQASRRLYEDGWDSSMEARHETTEIPLRSACVSQHNNTRAGNLCMLKQTWASSLHIHIETSGSLYYSISQHQTRAKTLYTCIHSDII